jgi:hypothetical protein
LPDVVDYWENASPEEWRNHVDQCLSIGSDLIRDWDGTFYDATQVLSDAYLSLHARRSADRPEPRDESELEDQFWALDRTSTVIDAIVGSACVALMRWMERAKWIALGDLLLLETKFPFETDREPLESKAERLRRSLMRDFGSKAPGTQVTGALAVWQIGNVFKHSGDRHLHDGTEKFAKTLGFNCQVLGIPENDREEDLRQMALKEVGYTLGGDSIERMALQLGCGPQTGLMPLYDHVESWQRDITCRLRDGQSTTR